ncbi:MAG: hypothetical protein WBH03_09815 [Cyclobacteriaceae bacterium]
MHCIKPLVYLFVSFTLIITHASCGHTAEREQEVIRISEGKAGMIAYGPLTSGDDLEVQLGRPYKGPFRQIYLRGYQRFWSAMFPNDLSHPPAGHVRACTEDGDTLVPESIVALNIEEAGGKQMNCFFFILDESDLARMDSLKKSYQRFDVSDSIVEFRAVGGPVYAYRAKPNYHKRPEEGRADMNVIPKRYLMFFIDAFRNLGEDYQREFRESSEHYMEDLVLDCHIADVEADEPSSTR